MTAGKRFSETMNGSTAEMNGCTAKERQGDIREMKPEDVSRVAQIWLDTNIKAHDFIPDTYWKEQFETVKEMLAQAEIYVYEKENEILGFIGFDGEYIAGIFVWSEAQSLGIGKQLLEYAKTMKEKLSLNVYQKNVRAVRFYQRELFEIRCEGTDESTGETEFFMEWRNKGEV